MDAPSNAGTKHVPKPQATCEPLLGAGVLLLSAPDVRTPTTEPTIASAMTTFLICSLPPGTQPRSPGVAQTLVH